MKPCASRLSDSLRALLLQREEVWIALWLAEKAAMGQKGGGRESGEEGWLGARVPPIQAAAFPPGGGYRTAAGPPGSGRNLRLAEVEGLGASLEPELSPGEQVQLRLHMEL